MEGVGDTRRMEWLRLVSRTAYTCVTLAHSKAVRAELFVKHSDGSGELTADVFTAPAAA